MSLRLLSVTARTALTGLALVASLGVGYEVLSPGHHVHTDGGERQHHHHFFFGPHVHHDGPGHSHGGSGHTHGDAHHGGHDQAPHGHPRGAEALASGHVPAPEPAPADPAATGQPERGDPPTPGTGEGASPVLIDAQWLEGPKAIASLSSAAPSPHRHVATVATVAERTRRWRPEIPRGPPSGFSRQI